MTRLNRSHYLTLACEIRHKPWLRNSLMVWSCMIVVFGAASIHRGLIVRYCSVEICYKIDALTCPIYYNTILSAVAMDGLVICLIFDIQLRYFKIFLYLNFFYLDSLQ